MPRIAPLPGIHYPIERFGTEVVPERVRTPDDDEATPPRLADLYDRDESFTRLPADLAAIEAQVRATALRNVA